MCRRVHQVPVVGLRELLDALAILGGEEFGKER
jgi:hypothetical protein